MEEAHVQRHRDQYLRQGFGPRSLAELAQSAAAEGRINYLEEFAAAEFLTMLEDAEREKRAVVLTRGRTTDFFEGVREACREAGLSYVVKYGDSGAEGFHAGFSWAPGQKGEKAFVLNGGNPVLTADAVLGAAKSGLEAVVSIAEEAKRRAAIGGIEIEPGLVDAVKDYAGWTPKA